MPCRRLYSLCSCGGGTVRALKHHGGVAKTDLNNENLLALEKGLANLLQHIENITRVFGLPCVVAINAFSTDTAAELKLVEDKCHELGVNAALTCDIMTMPDLPKAPAAEKSDVDESDKISGLFLCSLSFFGGSAGRADRGDPA